VGDNERNYVLVSTDGHAGADVLGYRPYLDSRWHDEFDAWAADFHDGWEVVDAGSPDSSRVGAASYLDPINWDSPGRQATVEAQGIAAEVLFPNTAPPFYPSGVITAPGPTNEKEYARRWAGVQAHNRWMADFCADHPGRRFGIAQVFFNDIDDAVEEVRWAKSAGLAGVLLPGDHLLALANLYHPALDPLWATCVELDMPVHRHGIIVGEAPGGSGGVGGPALGVYEAAYLIQRALGQLILGGVLERFPDLKFVFTEIQSAWTVRELAKLEMFLEVTGQPGNQVHDFVKPALGVLTKSPREYFDRNVWMGSFLSPEDAQLRHQIGVDRIMWGADFPHHEGTFPYTLEALRANFGGLPETEVRMMTSLNAAKVYSIDLDKLQPVADRIGPTVGQIAQPLSAAEYPDDTICFSFGHAVATTALSSTE
jgi:predicted TIM-barrel fold metal-dependent hydrolase